MAIIIPKKPKKYNSDAERKVYQIIERDFSDEWQCIYSYKWARWTSSRETDFVLIHKDIGLISVEVKGGRVYCKEGKWFVKDRDEKIINLEKNPIVQASEGAVNLYREFRKKYNTFHVVIFPDIERDQFETSNGDFKNYIIFGDELKKLEKNIKKIIDFESQKSKRSKSKLKIDDLEEIRKHFDIEVSSSNMPNKVQYNRLQEELTRLTKEQMSILEGMLNNSKMSITGKAGTGKTILLKLKAEIEGKKKKRVLILVFNASLKDEIKREFNTMENVEVYTISKFMQDETEYKEDDTKELRKKFCETNIPWFFWDIVLVDEAQDIYNDVMDKICIGEKIYIFYDKNQNLCEFEVNNKFENLDFEPRLELKKNLRNGKIIEEKLEKIIEEKYIESLKNDEGEFVKLYFVNTVNFEENLDGIDRFMERKIEELGECMFLTTSISKETKFPQNQNYKTVRTAKGLEKACVLIYDEAKLIDSKTLDIKNNDNKSKLARNMLYTGCSRGIKEVYIFLVDRGKIENEKIAKRLNLKISNIGEIY